MKEYLVDVPVKINIWTRPRYQKEQFEVIKEARPSILFIQSDGGRNDKEWEAIYENRRMIDESIDWECKVYRLYEDCNNGLYAMSKKTNNLVWSTVDRCIFLEDDDKPAVSFFRFCAELLEKYKDDTRIYSISGLNYYGIYEKPDADYFFSGESCIWGTAYWKRSYMQRQQTSYQTSEYTLSCVLENARRKKKGYEKIILGYADNERYGGHIAGGEFFKNLSRFNQNQLSIVPKMNLISNLSDESGGEHTDKSSQLPRALQRIHNMETYELDFPLKHMEYVVPDLEYEDYVNRVLAWSHPWIVFSRKIEHGIRCIMAGDWAKIRSGMKHLLVERSEK